MTALVVLAALALAGVAAVALRRPVLRRIAVRNALRRRGETTLVVLGALLGTAIITGSLLVGDTLDASLRASAPDQLGPADVVIRAASVEAVGQVDAAVAGLASDDVDGTLRLRTVSASVATPADGGERRAVPAAQLLETDFRAAAAFGGDAEATGISGATPAPGRTAIGRDLADELGVGVGEELEAFAYGSSTTLTVDRVLPRTGVAGYWRGVESRSRNAFVAPGTIDRLLAAAPADLAGVAEPPSDLVLVSATGGVFDGAERTGAVTEELESALDGIEGVEIDPVKQALLDDADEAGDSFSELFLAVGSFAVLAGILLLVNIFVMLAEERKSELGMLRAVAMTRRHLVGALVVEGALYAVASALLGAVAGIGVGRAIVFVTEGILSAVGDLSLRFAPAPGSVATGFLVGLLISLASVLGTSVRISRVNIIRALRDLPEPAVPTRRWWTAGLAALVAAAAGAGAAAAIAFGQPFGALALPPLALLALAVLGARFLSRRAVVSAVAVLVLAWALVYDQVLDLADGDIFLFVLQGVILTFAAVALLTQNQETVGAVVRRLGGGSSLTTRLGLAYPLARRFRTGMTLAMYSLVVFTLTFIAVLSQVFAAQVDGLTANEAGGYDVLASSSPANPLAVEELERVDGVASASQLTHAAAGFVAEGRPEPEPWTLSGIDRRFLDGGAPPLEEWDTDRYPTEADVWQAVLADPGLVVPDAFFLTQGNGPVVRAVAVGDTLTVVDPATGAETPRTVAAISKSGLAFSGVMASRESVAQAVSQAVPDRYYVKVADGAEPSAVAADLQGTFVVNGVEARSFRAIAEENTETNLQFFRLMQGYLALGLVVGVAGLGVIMVRAVRERRRQVGMLRSLGLQARTVRSAFLLESAFITLEGIVVGTLLALVTAYQVIYNSDALGDFDVDFVVPWAQVALLAAVALVASLAATAAPARQAARISPAVALRAAD
jgi:putative ABC transport system permease protein